MYINIYIYIYIYIYICIAFALNRSEVQVCTCAHTTHPPRLFTVEYQLAKHTCDTRATKSDQGWGKQGKDCIYIYIYIYIQSYAYTRTYVPYSPQSETIVA